MTDRDTATFEQRPVGPEKRDIPRSVGYIAKLAGWSTKEARRRLLAADKANGGTILIKCGPRYYVTLSKLRQVFPDFGKKTVDLSDVETLSEIVVELRRKDREKEAQIRELRKRVRDLEVRLGINTAA